MHELEEIVQIIQKVGIKEFMDKKLFDKKRKTWSFDSFIRSIYPKECKSIKFLFAKEFNELLNSRI